MGKYTELKKSGKLVKFQNEPDWQKLVDQAKQEFKFVDLKKASLGEEFARRREYKSRLELEVRRLNVELEALSQILVDRLEDADETSFSTDIGLFFIQDDPHVSIRDRQAFNNWVRETGQEDLFTVNYQTSASIAKDKLMAGEPLPPGVAVFIKTDIRFRKANEKEKA